MADPTSAARPPANPAHMRPPALQPWAPGAGYVRLLEHDAEFSEAVAAPARASATRATYAVQVEVPVGEWNPDLLPGRQPFAVLVGTGLMMRDLQVGDRMTSQLVGPGDALSLKPSASVVTTARVTAPMRLLVLDAAFVQAARRWPALSLELLHRAGEWAHRALWMQAIGHQPRIEDRLVGLFGYMTERWGQVTTSGRTVDLAITHTALGRLVGARRPTVSLALKELEQEGRLTRTGDLWLVPESAGSGRGA